MQRAALPVVVSVLWTNWNKICWFYASDNRIGALVRFSMDQKCDIDKSRSILLVFNHGYAIIGRKSGQTVHREVLVKRYVALLTVSFLLLQLIVNIKKQSDQTFALHAALQLCKVLGHCQFVPLNHLKWCPTESLRNLPAQCRTSLKKHSIYLTHLSMIIHIQAEIKVSVYLIVMKSKNRWTQLKPNQWQTEGVAVTGKHQIIYRQFEPLSSIYKTKYLMTGLSNGICLFTVWHDDISCNALMKLVSVSQSGFIYCFQQEIKAVVAVVPVIKHTNVWMQLRWSIL